MAEGIYFVDIHLVDFFPYDLILQYSRFTVDSFHFCDVRTCTSSTKFNYCSQSGNFMALQLQYSTYNRCITPYILNVACHWMYQQKYSTTEFFCFLNEEYSTYYHTVLQPCMQLSFSTHSRF